MPGRDHGRAQPNQEMFKFGLVRRMLSYQVLLVHIKYWDKNNIDIRAIVLTVDAI